MPGGGRLLHLLLELGDLGLELGLELFGGLVLGHQGQHLLHDLEPFLRSRRRAQLFFRFHILRSEIGGHVFFRVTIIPKSPLLVQVLKMPFQPSY